MSKSKDKTASKVVPAAHCPWCGKGLDRAWNREGATPEPGDLAICFGCGEWMQFDDDLKSVKPSDESFEWIGREAEPRLMREVWLKFRASEKDEDDA